MNKKSFLDNFVKFNFKKKIKKNYFIIFKNHFNFKNSIFKKNIEIIYCKK